MKNVDQELLCLVDNLSHQLLRFRVPQTPKVIEHLKDLLSHLKILVEQQRPVSEHLQITYDLLVVCASKIENEYQSQSWAVDQLLHFMEEKLVTHEDMPQQVKKMHPFRRGLVKNHGLTICDHVDLVREAYERAKDSFLCEYIIPIDRKLKMTLGNVFSGWKNLGVLFEVHPIFTQLMLPLGPLRKQFETFINRLVMDLLVEPKLNGRRSVLTLGENDQLRQELMIDFYGILKFLSIASDARLSESMGGDNESPDVQLIRSVIDLLKQARPIFLGGNPCRVQIALQDQTLLQETFIRLLTALSTLKPIYTWGEKLDTALNDLIMELKCFSNECLIVLKKPPAQMISQRSVWNLIGLWAGTGSVLNSTLNTFSQLYHGFLPNFVQVIRSLFPSDSFTNLIKKCHPLVNDAIKHGDDLINRLQLLGIYDSVTQAAIVPLRVKFLAINLDPLQRIIAIYRSHFEQFMLEPASTKSIWMKMSEEKRREIFMNLAAVIHHVNTFLPSLMAFLDPDTLMQTRKAFPDKSREQYHFDGLIVNLMKLQNIIMSDSKPLMQMVLNIFETSGEQLTAGQAASSFVSSHGSRFGIVVTGVVDSLTGYRLNLAFVPSDLGVTDLPNKWHGNTMKNILHQEFAHCFKYIDLFNRLDFKAVYGESVSQQSLVANSI